MHVCMHTEAPTEFLSLMALASSYVHAIIPKGSWLQHLLHAAIIKALSPLVTITSRIAELALIVSARYDDADDFFLCSDVVVC